MYRHKEAFALMRFRDDVTGEVEVLWNSRDGVTPFSIRSPANNAASHVDFDMDQCVPDYEPPLGSRVFVDLTLERAREYRTAFVDRWWDREVHGSKMSDRWDTKEAAIEDLARGDLEPPPGLGIQLPPGATYGRPDVVVVDEAFLEALRLSRDGPPKPEDVTTVILTEEDVAGFRRVCQYLWCEGRGPSLDLAAVADHGRVMTFADPGNPDDLMPLADMVGEVYAATLGLIWRA